MKMKLHLFAFFASFAYFLLIISQPAFSAPDSTSLGPMQLIRKTPVTIVGYRKGYCIKLKKIEWKLFAGVGSSWQKQVCPPEYPVMRSYNQKFFTTPGYTQGEIQATCCALINDWATNLVEAPQKF